MSKLNAGKSAALVLLVVAVFCGLWPMQEPVPRADGVQNEPNSKLERFYFGEEMCKSCHYLPQALPADKALLNRGVEMETWVSKDKHKNATKVLSDDRGKLMAKNLGYDVSKSAQCLSCHGVHVTDEGLADPDSFTPQQRIDSGVTCVACHGAYSNWVNEHSKPAKSKWKQFNREDKERDWGLRDLWDPATRAALCSSCHVGNVKEGKIVTHEMYAAGHPPLPGIEIATFGDALPRHWETITEKIKQRGGKFVLLDGKRKLSFTEFYKEKLHFDPGEEFSKQMEQTQLVAHSAVAVFQASMEMIAAHAEIHAKKKNGDGWPEFAMYDCAACHHDLKADSWRLERPSSGVPGRPGARTWSATLLPLLITHANGNQKEFADKLEKLDRAFTATPFGRADDIAKASRELVEWSNTLQVKLNTTKLNKADSTALLKRMFDRSAGKSLDFDSARQMSWGAKALFGELHPNASKSSPFSELDKLLSLTLPQGQVPIVGPFLTGTLEKMGTYEPKDFRAEMKKIAGSVKKD
jgi:hypothetical protein